MPPIISIALLLFGALLFTDLLVLTPLEFIRTFSIPNWVVITPIVIFLAWCFGEK